MDSPDLSDYEDIPEVSFSLNIQPYMYEPEKQNDTNNDSSSSDFSDESYDSGDSTSMPNPDSGTEWCSCSFCFSMPTVEERKCCHDIDILQDKLENIECITQHEGFTANCLNMHVLETSFYEFAEEYGNVPQENIHRTYRLVAYRRFIRWTWKVLGKKNRKVIPSCAVSAIRRTFPSEQFTGFHYPRF
ncbi:P2X purinoceptor 7-like [Pecten maximus]|uniref:P2X purinoceptor 7-like n=1 Tax=Pecten maximus TaxID=6579 RepID=UPI001458EE74|nr:P2X purinoceptor 7-like [Pecten maximus]